MGYSSRKAKDLPMTLLLIALLIAFAAATVLVLADSGLRMWSAMGGVKSRQAAMRDVRDISARRVSRAARVVTRVSYARPVVSPVCARRPAAA
jgi:hypothetical protein